MKKLIYAILFPVFLYAATEFTGETNGHIRLQVTDSTSYSPINDLTVEVYRNDTFITSYKREEFRPMSIIGLKPGFYKLTISSEGYFERSIDSVEVLAGKMAMVVSTLKREAKVLRKDAPLDGEDLTIKGYRIEDVPYTRDAVEVLADDYSGDRTMTIGGTTTDEAISYDKVESKALSTKPGSLAYKTAKSSITWGGGKDKSSSKESYGVDDIGVKESSSKLRTDDEKKSKTTDPKPVAGLLTAGEWNDIQNWDFWMDLHKDSAWKTMHTYWDFDTRNRYEVVLRNAEGREIPDAKVALKDNSGKTIWVAHTDNFGKAQLYAGMFENQSGRYNATADIDGKNYELGGFSDEKTVITKKLDAGSFNSTNLDLMFMVDATGSMGDEMNYLKSELVDVVRRIKAQEEQLNVRVGSVFYKDYGDEYVTRNFDFTNDVKEAVKNISAQYAGGGGDFPEAVESGLEAAITKQSWSEHAVSRLCFLILDAPPHYTPEVVAKLQTQIKAAAAKGIKLIPVMASGIDKQTEFLMRYFSVASNGDYIFITDDSGIGGSHIKPTIGAYDVVPLNDLIVKVALKYSHY